MHASVCSVHGFGSNKLGKQPLKCSLLINLPALLLGALPMSQVCSWARHHAWSPVEPLHDGQRRCHGDFAAALVLLATLLTTSISADLQSGQLTERIAALRKRFAAQRLATVKQVLKENQVSMHGMCWQLTALNTPAPQWQCKSHRIASACIKGSLS